jgi:formate-dependent nitrite reductase membrane component NrfD
MIKRPTWRWYIPFYFFLGGLAGGAAMIGAAASLFARKEHRSTVRNARYLAFVAAIVSPILLIVDLGRPSRFHHMLRIFKISSPLNVGTWLLSGFGAFSGILAMKQAAEDDVVIRRESGFGRFLLAIPSQPLDLMHGLMGAGLGSYTGVLLAATAVPLWAAGGILLGPLFMATAMASGAATLTLMGILSGKLKTDQHRELELIETTAAITQLGIVAARETILPEEINRHLRQGLWGRIWQLGALGGGLILPLGVRAAMRLSNRRVGRVLAVALSILTILGSRLWRPGRRRRTIHARIRRSRAALAVNPGQHQRNRPRRPSSAM